MDKIHISNNTAYNFIDIQWCKTLSINKPMHENIFHYWRTAHIQKYIIAKEDDNEMNLELQVNVNKEMNWGKQNRNVQFMAGPHHNTWIEYCHSTDNEHYSIKRHECQELSRNINLLMMQSSTVKSQPILQTQF